MGKQHNSKKTIDTILTVSAKLFCEKGYDKTSLQDICKESGISKGAIYHHFASKEEILNAVTEQHLKGNEAIIATWLSEMESLNGKKSIESLLEKSFASPETHSLDEIMSSQVKSSEFIVSYMKDCVNRDAAIISNLIKKGINDGSISCDYPIEFAEVFLLLLNIWCDPVIFECNSEKLTTRLRFLQYLMKSMGLDVLSDTLLGEISSLLTKLYFKEKD